DAQARAPDRGEVGLGEVLLAEVDPLRALVDRDPPVVVDHERGAMAAREREALADLGAQLGLGAVLDAQLHELDAQRQHAREPVGAVEDGIEAGQCHERNALPITGVEGTAMSRGSIGSARQASCPARAASAKASAIFTGSPARATAVLTRMASSPHSIASAAWPGTPRPASPPSR